MKISIRENDCRSSYVTAINNPISLALHRETGRLWYFFDGRNVSCTREPLRQISLPPQVSQWWREFQSDRDATAAPLEFELEFPA